MGTKQVLVPCKILKLLYESLVFLAHHHLPTCLDITHKIGQQLTLNDIEFVNPQAAAYFREKRALLSFEEVETINKARKRDIEGRYSLVRVAVKNNYEVVEANKGSLHKNDVILLNGFKQREDNKDTSPIPDIVLTGVVL